MIFDILTLFPEMIDAVAKQSIIGRAAAKGYITVNAVNIRDYSADKHRRADDYPYGGGSGMVMTPQPIYDAYKSIADTCGEKPFVIYMTPQGVAFTQQIAKELAAGKKRIILLCGHYEGVDERVIEEIADMQLSIGDYVLTGGELPALCVCDAVARLVPGVLSSEQSYMDESHYNGMLEYPQYTRPPVFMGRTVPEVLLSGHHAKINEWRQQQSAIRTQARKKSQGVEL